MGNKKDIVNNVFIIRQQMSEISNIYCKTH